MDAFGGCLLHDRQPYLRNDYKEIDGDDDGLWGITDRDGEFGNGGKHRIFRKNKENKNIQ